MLISCPNCSTNFSVPDKALAPNGRTLKCAKCGHKWFQVASRPEDDFGLDEDSFPPPPRPDPVPEPRPMFSAPESDLDFSMPSPPSSAAARASADLDVDLDEPPFHNFGSRPRDDDEPPPDFDLDGASEPIPDVFSTPPKTKKGTGGLW
ncbi:MAG: zinc-ribbon domain-containing protein, partial [Magnetospirillum sp.]|nr:zinc-ribbon domain-containing protein [Magnetospirillum sp.]